MSQSQFNINLDDFSFPKAKKEFDLSLLMNGSNNFHSLLVYKNNINEPYKVIVDILSSMPFDFFKPVVKAYSPSEFILIGHDIFIDFSGHSVKAIIDRANITLYGPDYDKLILISEYINGRFEDGIEIYGKWYFKTDCNIADVMVEIGNQNQFTTNIIHGLKMVSTIIWIPLKKAKAKY